MGRRAERGGLSRVHPAAHEENLRAHCRRRRAHLQLRPRHTADDAPRARPGARALRAPEDEAMIAFGVQRSAFEVLVLGFSFLRTRTCRTRTRTRTRTLEPRTPNAERRTPNAIVCR